MKTLRNLLICLCLSLLFSSCISTKLSTSEFSRSTSLDKLDGTYLFTNYSLSRFDLGDFLNSDYNIYRGSEYPETTKMKLKFNGKDSLVISLFSQDTIFVDNRIYKGKIKDGYFQIYLKKEFLPFIIFVRSDYIRMRIGHTEKHNLRVHVTNSVFGMLVPLGANAYNEDRTADFSRVDFFEAADGYSYEVENKWGYKSLDGSIVIPAEYDILTDFDSFGIARVQKQNKWALVNKQGVFITDFEYSSISSYNEKLKGYEVTVDKTEVEEKPEDDDDAAEEENTVKESVIENRNFGLISTEGEIIIPAKYNVLAATNIDNLISVEVGRKMGFYLEGKMICPLVLNYKYDKSELLFKQKKIKGVDSDMKYISARYNDESCYFGLDGFIYLRKLREHPLSPIIAGESVNIDNRIDAMSLKEED